MQVSLRLVRRGGVRRGQAGKAALGAARSGNAGEVSHGVVRPGGVRQVWCGMD
jgi:hypothetical protein